MVVVGGGGLWRKLKLKDLGKSKMRNPVEKFLGQQNGYLHATWHERHNKPSSQHHDRYGEPPCLKHFLNLFSVWLLCV